ncbi:hypothetical protein CERSUDRAFT_90379 [Gelatoporia subvermispora B]|uniref:ER membrane protein complex subunit 7 beta-sandwich domain-containing protein n=1 Tax=Ceriporiopsis subvermispora (strain B) TaxID=914234 RepID=M2QXE9_CERS8|nr:hypothetical protein CERSUDRAFT_90379 [Gelatoporia subvermispora B]
MRHSLGFLFIASVCCSAFAFDLRGRIQWNDVCPDFAHLGYTKVELDNGKLHGSVTEDGGFTIPDVPPGTYVMSVAAHDHVFEKLRVDVFESDSLPEVRPYFPGTPLSPPSTITLPYPIVLYARQKNDYFVSRESFNVLGMLQNPMMMLTVVVGGMMLLMPYIMKHMDPETLQDFNQRQARISKMQSSLQSGDISSSLSALMATNDEPKGASSSSARPAPPSGTKSRAGKGKKR